MIKREDMFIKNLKGTLIYKDKPLTYFNISDGRLVEYKKLIEGIKYLPFEFALDRPMKYEYINEFFRLRVVLDGSQDIREYLDALGFDHYDFEKIVKFHSGRNYLDEYWVAMEE